MDSISRPPRVVWNYRSADWDGLCNELSDIDFSFIDSKCKKVEKASSKCKDEWGKKMGRATEKQTHRIHNE